MADLDPNTRDATARRRTLLARRLQGATCLLMAGRPRIRNYPGYTYEYRASSHFLYFFGLNLIDGAAVLDNGVWTLFVPVQSPQSTVWQGEQPSAAALGAALGCAVRPRDQLDQVLRGGHTMTLPAPDGDTAREQSRLLGRTIEPGVLAEQDLPLADAVIELRLRHDQAAVSELRRAAKATIDAHLAGARVVSPGQPEWKVRAAVRSALALAGMGESFPPIVTTRGEFLHMETSDGTMARGDLLLVDAGAETPGGWAGDITRTWPVGGRFSATQRAAYQVVMSARRAALDAALPGTRYREVHLAAARAIAAGLVDLGVFQGHPAELVADGAVAMFFPHGVGHLLGLDVHDMEDLGDRCGYPPARSRSMDPVLRMLRLDRELAPGMVVTIEPGLYFNPHLIDDAELATRAGDRLDRSALAHFSDVHGIRVEDDILITDHGNEVLTEPLARTPDEVEALLSS